MKVHGTGLDLVETERVRHSIERFGDRFLQRCFRPDEIAYCRSMKYPDRHFAARFAAKEAIAKAFGTGIGQHVGWLDMEIGRHPSGAPFVKLHGKGQTLAATRGIIEVQVSLTHTATHAAASALALSIS